ncbi:natural product biosynthesis luciferase-like monooxygenase domain-containing protein [Roseivivax lentus]|uniref:Natural product biosynthesis luciferase-like monooxygenase domain-containing protein n=1 Tax=Roseivivax lentus TaxID=633194 RepID=A0A1N7JWA8_9RHOB|nr:MupA/Atu3671 family FMN-dependent luciferase-like monooxygenase [Roseivivax lentus]SIS53484.1 natural product biosynthesis luciferase-like monooxygenase domain-containing protein [Roseivivax lentus]
MFSAILIGNDRLTREAGDKLLRAGHRITACVSRDADIRGWAEAAGLPVIAPGAGLADRLAGHAADWVLSVANLDLLPSEVLALGARGGVNFHDGPLPRYAGLNAPVWALMAGETRHGITWHMMEEGVDRGDILVARSVEIGPEDTALTLNMKCFAAALDSFDAVIEALSAGAPDRFAQPDEARSYFGLVARPAHHGVLDFGQPAATLARLVRALDHGGYWNPLALPKIMTGAGLFAVGRAEPADGTGAPGTVLAGEGDSLTLACAEGALRLSGLTPLPGTAPVLPRAGDILPPPPADDLSDLARAERGWRDRLEAYSPANLPGFGPPSGDMDALPLSDLADPAGAMALLAGRLAPDGAAHIACATPEVTARAKTGLSLPWLPVAAGTGGRASEARAAFHDRLAAARAAGPFARDLPARMPELAGFETPALAISDGAGPVPGALLTLEIGPEARLHYDTGAIPADMAALLADRLRALDAHDGPAAQAPLMDAAERRLTLETWNATDRPLTDTTMIDRFEAQVDATPDATALVFEDHAMSFRDLDDYANRIAHLLCDMGAGPDSVVALHLARGPRLMAAAFGVLKAGAAYLPLDPAYPADRQAHYLADSGAAIIVTESTIARTLPRHKAAELWLDSDTRLFSASPARPGIAPDPGHLAYLIYTSGSTGKPKGVMIEHAQVANFFTAMDAVVPDPGGTWLAVTSLNFDISVLELFYAVSRGFKVVMASENVASTVSSGPRRTSGMNLSLYYWGNDDGTGRDKYRTLLEGAKFADAHGFCAVWTPERHFHAFGGPYPNPSVTGAAVAGVTSRIGVRAGSCVAPLHHPARVAEEWAVIDNLTEGRAGLAIASGWQPDDFVLRPENAPPDNKAAMLTAIDQIRRLWRGEAVGFPRADGSLHEVVTQPRPVSPELPLWVTTAGNPETWREAGRLGANVLTHLLGQSIEEVGEKIAIYRAARAEAGLDPEAGEVCLMLHTYLAETRDAARETAREPMKDYLRSAAGLIKQYAWAFPAFKKPKGVDNPHQIDLGSLEAEELEGILDFAFERYFNDSGLFGTIEDAVARIADLKAIGVKEVACLIDYGIAPDVVLDGLKPLAEVVAQVSGEDVPDERDFSVAAQIRRHGATHLQCTPSLMRLMLADDGARAALRQLDHIFLGGEALPGPLVDALGAVTRAKVQNMYGPTETTIWSAVGPAQSVPGIVPIGAPIANTALYVLDEAGAPCAIGQPGALWIGGKGVARGYWQRDALTADRFRPDPFAGSGSGAGPARMYCTGDSVMRRADGRLEFLGRTDGQVKLRGMRIELGEVEARIEALDGVTQAAALVRADRLLAYVTGTPGDEAAMKAALAARLPAHMVPARIVTLDTLPLTPNKKVDRTALPDPAAPAPQSAVPAAPAVSAAPAPEVTRQGQPGASPALQAELADLWAVTLGVGQVAAADNFFALGGHSLLAVELHRAIRDGIRAKGFSITDVFRFPTLGAMAQRVAELRGDAPVRAAQVRAKPAASPPPDAPPAPMAEAAPIRNPRADARRAAMAKRREMRARAQV